MPLVKIQEAGTGSQWGLWHISESESQLLLLDEEPIPEEIFNTTKRLEWKTGRILAKELATRAGLSYQGLDKDPNGKPSLRNHSLSISLSHSYPYVAAQLSAQMIVGIDVEQPKPKLLKIASRVLSPEELKDAGQNVVKHCVYWCAKESMYKIHSVGGLHFSNQLTIDTFSLQPAGKLQGSISNNSGKQNVTLGYEIHPDFVIVYTLNS